MALLHIKAGGLPLLVPDDVEAGPAPHPQGGGAAEEGGGLHLGGQHPKALPSLPFIQQLIAHRHPAGAVLAVEGILALDHSGVPGLTQVFGGLDHGGLDLIITDGGELDGGILPAGALHADGPGGDDHIVGLDLQIDPPAGAHPDKSIHANGGKLLHGDGSRRPADAGGTDADLLPQKGAGVNGVLPVGMDKVGVVKISGDLLTPARISRQDAVTSHVPFPALDMELQFVFLHHIHLIRNLHKFFEIQDQYITICRNFQFL